MKEIQLTQGKVALVDDEDFEYLNQFKWQTQKRGHTFYASRSIYNKEKIYMHGSILNNKGIDHIDGNGLNNIRSNIRLCSQSQNNMNRRKNNNASSIYKGVCWSKRVKKWECQISKNKNRIHLGYFNSDIEAAKYYNEKAIELFGEFCKLNYI